MRIVLVLAAAVFSGAAVYLSYRGLTITYDDSYSAQVVGGDAYNHIIYATRGTAWVGSGIVSAVLGATSAVLAQLSPR